MIKPDSAKIFRSLAEIRRNVVNSPEDIPQHLLKELIDNMCNATEQLLIGLETAQDTLVSIYQRLGGIHGTVPQESTPVQKGSEEVRSQDERGGPAE